MEYRSVWFAARRRVKVITRHGRGVRGVAVGYLTAYDRFMNVVLRDVQESYTVLVKKPIRRCKPPPPGSATASDGVGTQNPPLPDATAGALGTQPPAQMTGPGGLPKEAAAAPEPRVVRWVRKQEHRQRQLGQIFIKGDSIVSVSYMPRTQA
ncbi:MAG: hypothetical protein WDW36_003753 [Sanguina aurantia]